MRFAICIPCRLNSNRLPNKPLRKISGKSLIQWTLDNALKTDASEVYVVSDDAGITDSISNAVRVICPEGDTGTHRLALSIKAIRRRWDRIVNLQVDEPFVEVNDLNRLGSMECPEIGTLVGSQIFQIDYDPHVVKAIVDDDRCHWFSRYYMGPCCYAHVGVYSFRPETLVEVGPLSTVVSREASLEQLAWLQAGYPMRALPCTGATPMSINTEADLYLMESKVMDLQR